MDDSFYEKFLIKWPIAYKIAATAISEIIAINITLQLFKKIALIPRAEIWSGIFLSIYLLKSKLKPLTKFIFIKGYSRMLTFYCWAKVKKAIWRTPINSSPIILAGTNDITKIA